MNSDSSQPSTKWFWRRRRVWLITGLAVALIALVSPLAWHAWLGVYYGEDAFAPTCDWSAHIRHATPDQDGLIRCYLAAEAHHSLTELRAVTASRDDGGPIRLESSDLAHSREARSGVTTVTVVPNEADTGDALVDIHFADGATQTLDMHLANPMSDRSWRIFTIGVYPPD